MGLKEKLFILFLIGVIFFPFFFSKKEIKIEKKIKLPYIELKNGFFKTYDEILKENGNFKTLQYFNSKYYISKKLKIKFLDKNSSLFAKKLVFNGKYNFFDAKYITPTYTYLAKKAIYDDKTKILIAYNFKFFNEKIDGKGLEMIYKDDKIIADNIIYTIKGFK